MFLHRFTRIRREFGLKEFIRTIIMLIALVGVVLLGAIGLQSPWAAIIAIVGLGIGWLLRKTIVEFGESLFWALPAALFVYGIVLFVGERVLGLSREAQLLIITVTTVITFNLQFWILSDPSFVRTEQE